VNLTIDASLPHHHHHHRKADIKESS